MSENNKKVLIVEDDEHISRVYEIKLSKEGIQSSTVRDGEDAVAKITSERPSLILLDLMIPKKDGFWVLEQLEKNPDLVKIPVIVLSNLGQQSDQERALGLGAEEYLVKVDTSIQEVVDKVKKYLG